MSRTDKEVEIKRESIHKALKEYEKLHSKLKEGDRDANNRRRENLISQLQLIEWYLNL